MTREQKNMFLFRQKNMFFIKTREHENKREGWKLACVRREHEVWLGFAQHSLLAYPHLNHWIFHSSLKPLDSSLFVLHSSLKLRFAQPPHNHLHLSCRQPFNVLLVSLFHECVVQLGATFNPHHQSVYGHVWVGRGEVEEGKLLLGVGL